MAAERAVRSYRLEPLDSSGVFLGLGVVQCALLGAGLTTAVLAITAGAPAPLAAAPLAVAAAASFARAGGHLAWEWLVLGGHWAWAGIRRGRRWQAPLPLWSSEPATTPLPDWMFVV
jgi:hypothetical protein